MIPNYESQVRLIKERHPQAWKDAHTGNANTEDFIRILAKHLHDNVDPNVALNGKRGNPDDISDDALNILDPEGPGTTPDGRRCWVVDVIGRAGSTKPDEPPVVQWSPIADAQGSSGAWVKPTLNSKPSPRQPSITLPGRKEMMEEAIELDRFYSSAEGLQRENGLSINGRPDWEGVGAWLLDVYLQERVSGKDRLEARAAMQAAIKATGEWQGKHPGERP